MNKEHVGWCESGKSKALLCLCVCPLKSQTRRVPKIASRSTGTGSAVLHPLQKCLEPEGFGRVDVSLEGSVMRQPEAISAPKCQFTTSISL